MPKVELSARFSIAPMMDWSDRHCRYFWRLFTRHALLYTEMITCGAILQGDRKRFLQHHSAEHPIAAQLGGSDAKQLVECCKIVEDWGYDEINLNCGCPSDRVQTGKIGACLMAEPDLVADCVEQMITAVSIPITVKHRLGIDELDSEEHLHHFVAKVASAGCERFIVHARKALLSGLSPKQNREIPPLQYERVINLKKTFPGLNIVLNGGVKTLAEAEALLEKIDGVMMGREAYSNPYVLAEVDSRIFGDDRSPIDRDYALDRFMEYCAEEIAAGNRLHHMTRHILGLYAGEPGARHFRRYLGEFAGKDHVDEKVLYNARQNMNKYR